MDSLRIANDTWSRLTRRDLPWAEQPLGHFIKHTLVVCEYNAPEAYGMLLTRYEAALARHPQLLSLAKSVGKRLHGLP